MGRIIGIDFGLKRIGIAITDPLKIFAQPLTTVFASDFPKWLSDYAKTSDLDISEYYTFYYFLYL
jgi:putative Holliday junction resolvase